MMNKEGLYEKYTVIDNETGKQVYGTFTLTPEKDPVAVTALYEYAFHTTNEKLSDDICRWLHHIEENKQ